MQGRRNADQMVSFPIGAVILDGTRSEIVVRSGHGVLAIRSHTRSDSDSYLNNPSTRFRAVSGLLQPVDALWIK